MAAPVNQTTPIPSTLTIVNRVEPATDADLFDLRLNDDIVAEGVGDGGTSGAIMLPMTGTYTVSVQSAVQIPLDSYETTLTCIDTIGNSLFDDSATSAVVDTGAGKAVTCTFLHIRRPEFRATLDDRLLIDADVETEPGASPGDTIQLQAVITKEIGITGTNVIFSVDIDSNTEIVSGTLTTNGGIIAQGSSSEDSTVRVIIGDVANDTPIVITWNIMVRSPLPNVDTVVFQGKVISDNGKTVSTDDPSIPALADPTEISVTSKPLLNVTHVALLLIDADNNQKISAGDSVYYEVTVINIGNGPALNLTIEGTVDPNTMLVLESLRTTQGTIMSNGPELTLSAGTLNGGEAKVTLSYHVVVDSETTATAISSQFEASADLPMASGKRIRVFSDDPTTLMAGDATTAAIIPAPSGEVNSPGIYLPYISAPAVVR